MNITVDEINLKPQNMNFEEIILEREQQDLFIQIVEKVRKIPRDERKKMIKIKTAAEEWLVIPSQKSGGHEIKGFAGGDLEELSSKGLLRKFYNKNNENFNVTPEGFRYYDWLIKQQGKPVERIEQQIFRYLEFEDFRKQYPDAYRKIKQAEEILWSVEEKKQHSQIGICCRDAMQEFADQLYRIVLNKPSEDPKSKTVNRIRRVIDAKKKDMGETVHAFLDALLPFWGTVSDLVQRNAHATEKKGKPISMEDSRRVVFQTVNVMVELHRTIDMK